jgi:predicted transport protein
MVLHKEPDAELQKGFKNISKLKVDVCYPFLLPVYNDFETGTITNNEFKQIICLVENYVFRRAICGIPTNSMNKTFATLYKAIQKTDYLEGVKAAFQILDSYKRFPTDTEFEKEIVVKEVYNFRNRNYMLSNVDDYTIEHIIPQNPELSNEWQKMLGEDWKEVQSKYLHSLGNLTLTGYNSELSDKPFSQKKTIEGGFNDSPIRLNDFLRKVDIWNAENIEARAKELAEKACQIWFAPNLSQDVLDKYNTEEKTTTMYTLEQYEQLKGEMLDLYHALKKRILNIDSSVKEEYKKLYIAFKSSTNFVDIVPQKVRLRLSLNIDYPDIIDPKGLCKDVSGLGRWGNGDVEVGISNMNELDDVMELIQQAFDKQLGYL